MKSVILRLRVKPSEIAYLRFILEGHDGMALMRTLDSGSGMVCLHVAPGCETDVTALLKSIQSEITIEHEG